MPTHGYSVEACPAPTPPPTFARWLGEEDAEGRNPLRDQYARAKEAQADYMAEELAELLAGRELGEHGELGSICTNPAGKGDTLPDELHTHRPPARRAPTDSERAELLALISAADTDLASQEATDAALADPEAALQCYRAIANERGITVELPTITKPTSITVATGCKSCRPDLAVRYLRRYPPDWYPHG